MPRTGRPKTELTLTAEEREQLTRDARRATSAQALALRSRIVLGCADGHDNKTVAERVRCSANTVAKWRKRFIEHRLDGLLDEARPGRPRTISVDQVEDVIVATLESTPPNATHWTRSKMAARTGLSKTTIGKIWKDFGLKPHRVDHFKLSTDPLFIDKLHGVVGLYLNPPRGRGGAVRGREIPGPGPATLAARSSSTASSATSICCCATRRSSSRSTAATGTPARSSTPVTQPRPRCSRRPATACCGCASTRWGRSPTTTSWFRPTRP